MLPDWQQLPIAETELPITARSLPIAGGELPISSLIARGRKKDVLRHPRQLA